MQSQSHADHCDTTSQPMRCANDGRYEAIDLDIVDPLAVANAGYAEERMIPRFRGFHPFMMS